ncbi:MAG TPA: hypothetical protein VLF66_00010 [Thermoanaerobaculia bacterium]|nr:hypothetical protein [Thermoanaerobaculia bacterium]
MAIDVQVIFTGLSLFCLNQPGAMCEGADSGFVYLVNAVENQTVCDRELDGGHRPRIAFDQKFLLPGSTLDHRLEPTPDGSHSIIAPLDGLEVCIRKEPVGPGEPYPQTAGAKPIDEYAGPEQSKPRWWKKDSNSFDWIVNLSRMHDQARGICQQAKDELGEKKLVITRVRLDQGTVMTPSKWHDSWGTFGGKMWRRMWSLDYLVWEADPYPAHQKHFPKALPGQALWEIEGIPEKGVVLVEDCRKEPRRTLFRLRPEAADGEDLKIHISNVPDRKPGSPGHAHLEHFRWYYRLVEWGKTGCAHSNVTGCPTNLSIPKKPEATRSATAEEIEGVIVQTDKCPPAGG